MKALGFHEHGGLENLSVLDLPVPEPGPGEVRLRVAYAALNRLDLFVLKGWKGLELEKPHVGGSDGAGVVDAVGPGVTRWKEGDRVVVYASRSCGQCSFCAKGEPSLCPKHRLLGEHERGLFAEYAIVPEANLLAVPQGVSLRDAAAASLVFLTAWRMLVTRARLRAGESVLIVGAAGGVNTAAVQIARHLGAHPVIAVGTDDAKLALARELGATHTVRADADWSREAFAITQKRGVDVVVDNVGAKTWAMSLRAAARGGRIVTVGGTTGYDPPAQLNQLFWKQLDVLGSTMGSPAEFATVMALVFEGKLKAVVDQEYPLDKGIEAYRRLAEGEARGKVVLRMA